MEGGREEGGREAMKGQGQGVGPGGANGGLWSLPCINSNSLFTTVFKNFQWALQIERSHTSSKEGT